jgi:hypothetical protein
MTYSLILNLKRLVCRDTESIHSSDKFALTGAMTSDEGTVGIYFPMHRINSGESWDIFEEYILTSKSPRVQISLFGYDLDENDSWTENIVEIKAIQQGISTIVGAINAPAGTISGAVGTGVIEAVNAFNKWDNNDKVLDYNKEVQLAGAAFQTQTLDLTTRFKSESFADYSGWDYTLEFSLTYTRQESFGPVNPAEPNQGETILAEFRQRSDVAGRKGFVGAFPNFYYAKYGLNHVGGTIFLNGSGAEWQDLRLADLGGPALTDFGARMRATQVWATRNGFVGGFPNGYHADHGTGIVCGTILLRHEAAEWRDIPLAEMSSPELTDIGARFRGAQDWASRNGYIGGFPTMFHVDGPSARVAGVILIKPIVGHWEDVVIFTDAR